MPIAKTVHKTLIYPISSQANQSKFHRMLDILTLEKLGFGPQTMSSFMDEDREACSVKLSITMSTLGSKYV